MTDENESLGRRSFTLCWCRRRVVRDGKLLRDADTPSFENPEARARGGERVRRLVGWLVGCFFKLMSAWEKEVT